MSSIDTRRPRRALTTRVAAIVPLAVLVLFFVVMFREALFGGRFILVGDPLKQFYPLRTVAWEMIRGGSFPLWTPHILSGYPMFSMMMLGIGYPLTWGYLFVPGHWAEQLYVLAPYLLSPIFTYAYLRELGRSPAASVLGGLTFGYGGFLFSPIGLTGVHANSALWMPLVLLGVAHARRRSFVGSLLLAAAAYTMSVLAGSAQIFLYAGALALAYGAFLAVFPDLHDRETGGPALRRRWQPPAVAAGSIVLAVGLTSFQMFETWTAVNRSIRDAYPVERFKEGSFPPMLAWRSLLQPLGNYWDSATFVPLLALALAVVAVLAAGRRASHVYFWFFVAVMAWLLVLGKHTPLFDLYAHIPFVTRFRFPSRHTLEWTFAIGVLAAYGWDILEEKIRKRRGTALTIGLASACVLLAFFLGSRWIRHTANAGIDRIADLNNAITQLDGTYLAWKLACTLSFAIGLWLLCRLRDGALRMPLLTGAIALYCFVEPYLWMVRPVIVPWSVSRELFGSFAETTHVLQQHLGRYERTYSLPHPYAVSSEPVRDVDAVNWTALAGIQDANGYESLILARYSRMFRGEVDTEPFVYADWTLLGLQSQVLDLLNVRFVTSFANFSVAPDALVEKDGIEFSPNEFAVDVKRDATFSLSAAGTEADSLALVTTLGVAGFVEQGAPVARISVHCAGGRVVERDLLAGVHTSEMTYDRPDVKAVVRHGRAPIFDSGRGDPAGNFQSHRFLARIDLGERVRVTRVDFLKTAADAGVGLWKVSLHDSKTGRSAPLPQPPPEKWQTIHDKNGVVILKNLRTLPRAWLVTKVQTLDEAEILRRIRGESAVSFNPRQTALVEIPTREWTAAGGQASSNDSAADSYVDIVRYEPARIVFDTNHSQKTMLVVGEIHYPGWIATVDGAETPIHVTNFLLRGVFLPPGRHTIEMTYQAPGARRGALVSLATVALIGVIARSRRLRRL